MITVAYVGFGVSVREYHIPYVENRNDIKIKYVFRREQDIAQFADYEPFYPEITFTTDFDEVLHDQEVDLVVVSAPDAFHVPYAKQILNAGKHALIEKPFAPTAALAREGRRLYVVLQARGGGAGRSCGRENFWLFSEKLRQDPLFPAYLEELERRFQKAAQGKARAGLFAGEEAAVLKRLEECANGVG